MRYEFILNGVDVTSRVALGANVKERFAEELDVGSVTLSYLETEETIKVLNHLEIIKYDNEDNVVKRYDMLVTRDDVEPITKDNNLFRHELSLIELTHKLDYFIVNALSFTQPIVEEVSAPFEHKFSITASDANQGRVGTLEFPELPKIVGRYYDGKISIPQIGQALLSLPQVPTVNLTEVGSYDVLLNIQIQRSDLTFDNVVVNHNISQGPLELEDLEDGRYFLRFFVDDSVIAPKALPEEDDVTVNFNREFIYQTTLSLRKRYTLFDVINRIRNTYPLERADLHEQTRLFNISTELENKLKQIEAPQFYFNKLTTREAINNALRYVNAVSRLLSDNGDYELVANFFNERRGSFLFDDTTKFQKEDSQDVANYASNNRAFLNNTIASNNTGNPSVQEIGDSFYKGLRSEDYQILPENGKLMLKYDIFRLVKIIARVKVRVSYGIYTAPSVAPDNFQDLIEELDLDITPYVVEETQLNLRDPFVDVFGTSGNFTELRNQFFRDKRTQLASYKYRGNFIDFGGAVGSFYQRTRLNRILFSAITERLSYRTGERLRDSQGDYVEDGQGRNWYVYRGRDITDLPGFFDPTIDLLGKDGTPLNLTNTDYLEEIGFNVTYIAIENTIDDAHKEDTEEIDKYTEKIINNNDRIINYERAAISNYGMSQRLGVPTKKYGRVVKSDETEDVEQIGFVNDRNEVVVEKDNIFYKDHETYAVETSKDFNRLAKFISVDRQFRPTEIPQNNETLDRQDIYTEYIEYSTSNQNITPRVNNTFLGTRFLQTFFNTMRRDPNFATDFVKGALIRTDGFLQNYPDEDTGFPGLTIRSAILMPVISLGGKNNLSFEFKFKNNVSAGDSVVENREGGLDTVQDWWIGVGSQISGWLDSLFGNGFISGEDYSPRPYGLWRRFVTYGNDNGEFNRMHFTLLTDFQPQFSNSYFGETKNYPLVSETATAANYFEFQDTFKVAGSGSPINFNQSIVVNKDVSEVYSFKYQVTLVPLSNQDNRDVVIGEKLTSENLLVFPWREKELKLYLYTDPQKVHGTFDFEIANTPDFIVNLNQFTFDVLTFGGRDYGIEIKQDLSGINHWAIADEDGNLYLANNTNNKYVFFEPQNKRSTINYDW